MQWVFRTISHKSHAKFENMKILKVTNKSFKRHSYGKPKVSLIENLKYLVNITLYYT